MENTKTKRSQNVLMGVLLVVVFALVLLLVSQLFNRQNEANAQDLDFKVEISGSIVRVEYEDLFAQSSLVVLGTVTGCERIGIETATGGFRYFTNYYVDVKDVYRGESAQKTIVVRVMGASEMPTAVPGVSVWVSSFETSSFRQGETCVLFLYEPNFGGAYETRDDYYYVVGVNQGIFRAQSGVDYGSYRSIAYAEVINPETFKAEMIAINEAVPIDYDYHINYMKDSLLKNYENGQISEEGYLFGLAQLYVYGEIIETVNVVG